MAGRVCTAGDAIHDFTFIVNVDDTGTTDQRTPTGGCAATSAANYPQSCHWQSITEPSGWSPIYTQGNQSDMPAQGHFRTVAT